VILFSKNYQSSEEKGLGLAFAKRDELVEDQLSQSSRESSMNRGDYNVQTQRVDS